VDMELGSIKRNRETCNGVLIFIENQSLPDQPKI